MASERFVFLRPEAERIAKAVRRVEGMREGQPLTFRRVTESGRRADVFRVATFTGSWAINTAKTLTFKNQTATPNTVSATNLYLGLDPTTACDALIAKAGTAWYLVQANLTKQPNYDSSAVTQVFTIETGDMKWADVQTCPEEDASPQSLSFFYG